ncbi:ChrR family anti-sigma-E factor [Marinimicrobium sp. ARAG 43.8]|uniref:ChrR family anti-sigma-E factor n=1 Tax=Marinimicrobium sp. ARAG 43.8 TaxID=3418719 RepID=UPI003CEEC8CC
MSTHHPDDLTLLEYAAGSLGVAQALAVSVHISFCAHCQQHLLRLNALGGALLSTTGPASVANDDQIPEQEDSHCRELDQEFDALMARLQSDQRAPETLPARKGFSNPLARYLPAPLENLAWQRQTREIAKYDLDHLVDQGSARVALQRIRAGARVPVHTHHGNELTVVLSGGFSDDLGQYNAGDFVARDPSHHHAPTALDDEDCICLTVLDAPMRFTGPLMRWLNPFMAWKA